MVGAGAREHAAGVAGAGPTAPGDVLREELARLLGAGGGPDAGDALDVLWIARLSGLDPVDWSLLGNGTDPTAPPPPDEPPPPAATPDEPPAAGPDPEPPSARLHLPGSPDAAARPGAAHPIRVAQPRALTDSLALTRALRPLRQTVPSTRIRTLDVDATAAASGDTRLLLPILRPARERRFSVDLLIDTGTTMTVWHRLADELRTLLARHGAFADVRAWALNTDEAEPTLAPFRRGAQAASPTRHWKQSLADPAGRRAVLVLTDGVGPAWYGEALPDALADWSAQRPVAALQVLPGRLWHRTALCAVPVRARGTETERAALDVRSSRPLPGIARGRAGAPDRARIRWLPALELSEGWLAPWARLVSGRTTDWVPLSAVPLTVVERPGPAVSVDESGTAGALVGRFEEGYSPEAFALLRLLAAAPLSLPVMRLVQRTMLPASTPMHLAEILLSGLLVRRTPAKPGEDPDGVLYDFRAGVRDALLDRMTRTESLRVLERVVDGVSERVAATFGGVTDFGALIAAAGDGTLDGLELPEGSRAFADVAVAVIERVGGDYRDVAAKLTRGRVGADGTGEGAPRGPEEEMRRRRERRRLRFSWSWGRDQHDGPAFLAKPLRTTVGGDGDVASRRPGARVPSRVPELPPFYVRRGEARELLRALSEPHPDRTPRTWVVKGPPAVGKTALVADCAQEMASEFSLVRWIRARSRETLLNDLIALADDLGIPPAEEEPGAFPARRLTRLRDYLIAHPRWLLIYDDVTPQTFAPHPDDPAEWGKLCRPPEGSGSLLVTLTPEARWPVRAYGLRLEHPDRESAVRYLAEMIEAQRGKTWKRTEELADLVDIGGPQMWALADWASVVAARGRPVGSLALERLMGGPGLDRVLRSLVWVTHDGKFAGTGVAVQPDAVLISDCDYGTGTVQGVEVHCRDGRTFRVRHMAMRSEAPGLVMVRTDEPALQAVPVAPAGERELVVMWHEPERRSKPSAAVDLASSPVYRRTAGTVLIDVDGQLCSMFVQRGDHTTKLTITPALVDRFLAQVRPRAARAHDRKPSNGPLFYLSYAHTPALRSGPDYYVHRLYTELTRHLAELTDTPQEGLGFFGAVLPGADWEREMKQALARAQVFVPLYSPRYFRSEWCGMEWDAFDRRQQRDRQIRRHTGSAIVPVLWMPTAPRHLPSVSWGLQYTDSELGPLYVDRGLLGLMESNKTDRFDRVVRQLAERIVHVAKTTRLAPCDPRLFDDLHNAFEEGAN